MTFKASMFLHFLKKVQVKEDYMVLVDKKSMIASTVWEDIDNERLSLDKFSGYLSSVIDDLIEERCLKKCNLFSEHDVYQVTHKGWHCWEVKLYSAVSLFARSIACPVVVSIITTLIVNFLLK